MAQLKKNTQKTQGLKIACSIPQGSVLGTPLFLIYTHNLPNITSIS